jgi:hypothetical protein
VRRHLVAIGYPTRDTYREFLLQQAERYHDHHTGVPDL